MGLHRSGSDGYVPSSRDNNAQYANICAGYNMAKNLQAKLPPSDTLRIYDINTESVKKFASEAKASSGGAAVQIASNVHEAAENSVSYVSSIPACSSFNMMSLFQTNDLSWGPRFGCTFS
jgi:hypothetical protein